MIRSTIASILVIFKKDLHSELRTRYALNALLMFVITTLSIILFSIGNESVSPELLAGILWVIVFFSSMSGLSRTFISEEEKGTVLTLHLLARPLTIYYGKLIFNTILLFSFNIFTVALFLIVVPGFTVANYGIFTITIILGTLGLASASTIIAAIIAKANTKGTLYPVLSFPILLPLLLTLINATKLSVDGAVLADAIGEFRIMISYMVVLTVISSFLFEYIWKE